MGYSYRELYAAIIEYHIIAKQRMQQRRIQKITFDGMLEADASSHTGCVVYSTPVCVCVAECFCDAHAYLVTYSRIHTNRKHP